MADDDPLQVLLTSPNRDAHILSAVVMLVGAVGVAITCAAELIDTPWQSQQFDRCMVHYWGAVLAILFMWMAGSNVTFAIVRGMIPVWRVKIVPAIALITAIIVLHYRVTRVARWSKAQHAVYLCVSTALVCLCV